MAMTPQQLGERLLALREQAIRREDPLLTELVDLLLAKVETPPQEKAEAPKVADKKKTRR